MNTNNTKERPWPAWTALVLVGLVELSLFGVYHESRWQHTLLPSGRKEALSGEGLVLRVDGLQYYAWLRSPLIDGDLSFDNEFDEYNVLGDFIPPPTHRTPIGRRCNMVSVGPACVWSLTVVPGHLGLLALEKHGSPWPANGYSWPYQLLVGCTTLLVNFLGLALLYGICREAATPPRSALAVAFIVLGTTIVYYFSVGVSMAHGLGATALAALIYYWLTTYGSNRPCRWLILGLLIGVAALMRFTLALYAILPATEASLAVWRGWRIGSGRIRWEVVQGLILAALGAIAAFSPQVLAWHCVFGSWLVVPTPQVTHHWLNPSWFELLLAQDRSLFYWTPMALFACLGYLLLLRANGSGHSGAAAQSSGNSPERLIVLFLAFALQVYAYASMYGHGPNILPAAGYTGGVFFGESYGCRYLTESMVALAPGLALLLERAPRGRLLVLTGVGCLLVFWNLLLVCLHVFGIAGVHEGASPSKLGRAIVGLARTDPLLVAVIVLAVICLALITGDRAEWKCQGAPRTGH